MMFTLVVLQAVLQCFVLAGEFDFVLEVQLCLVRCEGKDHRCHFRLHPQSLCSRTVVQG